MAVISAILPFCPVEHLFLHVNFICITCNHLCSQINDDDDDDDDMCRDQCRPTGWAKKVSLLIFAITLSTAHLTWFV